MSASWMNRTAVQFGAVNAGAHEPLRRHTEVGVAAINAGHAGINFGLPRRPARGACAPLPCARSHRRIAQKFSPPLRVARPIVSFVVRT